MPVRAPRPGGCRLFSAMPEHTEAYRRFWKSTEIGYMEWHDGIGYDVGALREMTGPERDETVAALRRRPQDWRDVEAYAATATADAMAALRDALSAPSVETRLRAAATLDALGLFDGLGSFLAQQLQHVTIGDGLTAAQRLAYLVPSDEVRLALLRGARQRPEVAFHFATTLCALTGAGRDEPYSKMRQLFLRLGLHTSDDDRARAFEQLCKITGMNTDSGESPKPV